MINAEKLIEKLVVVDHYSFNYYALGNDANLPILFLHGFMGSGKDFEKAINYLSKNYYCLAVDLPGHGKTEVRGEDDLYGIEQTAQGLIQFLDALKIKTCYLVGYSMGGRLGLYLLLNFPDRFSKATIESASLGLKTLAEREVRVASDLNLAQQLETEDFSNFLVRWYQAPLFVSLSQHKHFSQLLESRLQNQPLNLAKSLRHLSTGRQPNLWEDFVHNRIPVLLLAGELDRKFRQINQEMSQLCQTACLAVIDNCGHNIHFEQPNIYAEKVREFFSLD